MEKRIKSLSVSDDLTLGNCVVMRVKHGYVVEVLQNWKDSILLRFDNVDAVLRWLCQK